MAPTKALPDTHGISKSDRNALRSIVKGRIALLQEQINHRAVVIKREIRAQVEKEYADQIKVAEKRSGQIRKRLDAIFIDIESLLADAQAGHIQPDSSSLPGDYSKREIYECLTGWSPANLDQRVNQEFDKIKEDRGLLDLSLKNVELDLLEKLSVDSLEHDQAKKFLAEIPDIDKLLPIPNGNGLQLTK